MTHEEARLALAALLSDDYRHPSGAVAYAYCTGRYVVYLRTDDSDYVLIDANAVNVYRTTHPPQDRRQPYGAQQG